jgi:hypothetical protein
MVTGDDESAPATHAHPGAGLEPARPEGHPILGPHCSYRDSCARRYRPEGMMLSRVKVALVDRDARE